MHSGLALLIICLDGFFVVGLQEIHDFFRLSIMLHKIKLAIIKHSLQIELKNLSGENTTDLESFDESEELADHSWHLILKKFNLD